MATFHPIKLENRGLNACEMAEMARAKKKTDGNFFFVRLFLGVESVFLHGKKNPNQIIINSTASYFSECVCVCVCVLV